MSFSLWSLLDVVGDLCRPVNSLGGEVVDGGEGSRKYGVVFSILVRVNFEAFLNRCLDDGVKPAYPAGR